MEAFLITYAPIIVVIISVFAAFFVAAKTEL
ncbi:MULTISPECIES: cytochrome bd oxidase small subunit CydS [unclassified Solibacillus]